jgi:hypothetical protein
VAASARAEEARVEVCYTLRVDRRDVKAFAERAWRVANALKREHWAREFAERGPAATLAASHSLWQHMRLLRPDWPSDEERREDLAHHVVLKRTLDRAAGVLLSLPDR